MSLTLYGTPRSHFTRIVRICCLELSLEVQWIDVGNVGDTHPFGGNPLMQVPVLVDGDRTVWDSHNICLYLVERQGADPLGVATLDWSDRNRVAVIHGVMSAEVRLILAARAGMSLTGIFFDKARQTIRDGLAWLETHLGEPTRLTYPAVCAVAMWDHLLLYRNATPEDAPRLDQLLRPLATHPSLAQTR